jgi:hypothetical protein
MTFEQLTILILFTLLIVREFINYRQLSKLQELLKANDITEYYRAKTGSDKQINPSENTVMTEADQNDIAVKQEEFDIRKISEVIVDGQKKPIKII